LFYGYVGQVDYIVSRMIEEIGEENIKIIATGGLARHITSESQYISEVNSFLTLEGLRIYLGIKMVLFDITDVTNPVLKFTQIIGDRGTDSELLRNHKALLLSKEKNLLAFPVTLMEVNHKDNLNNNKDNLEYGQFVFQGAYIYNFDLNSGFTLKGKITHISEEEYKKSGEEWYDSNKNIDRILYIENNIYTLSNGMVKANNLSDLKELNSVIIP